jgi:hypothetical protein
LEEFTAIGKDNNYSEEHIRLYGDVIKLFSQYEIWE